uniref:Uncharacterized protein n=1 Tax=Siphoviridae sp. ctqPo10 TaxID=2827948 RepID=A0A8S5SVW9_9CAUD|nr:MAG TPA: hypothetical protein [Siphoviridae sp. ctqPo10]
MQNPKGMLLTTHFLFLYSVSIYLENSIRLNL